MAPADTIYDYYTTGPGGGAHDCYDCDCDYWDQPPCVRGKTENTQEEYDQVEAIDNKRWQTRDPGIGDEVFVWNDWVIDEDEGTVTNMSLLFLGYSTGATCDFRMWIYNYSTSTWGAMGADKTITTGVNTTMVRYVNSDLSAYINDSDNMVTTAISANDPNDPMRVDYMRLKVTYDSLSVCPTPTPSPSPSPTNTPLGYPTPTPTGTPTPTCLPSEHDTTNNLTGSEWWLWEVDYDDGAAVTNEVFHIMYTWAGDGDAGAVANVTYDAVGEDDSKELTDALPPDRGFSNFQCPAACLDWIADQSFDEAADPPECAPTRERRVNTGVVDLIVPTEALNTMVDARIYTKINDSMLHIDTDQLPRAYCTTFGMGDGDIPTDVIYSYGHTAQPANSSAAPNGSDGYPWSGSGYYKQWMWTFADGKYITGDQPQETGYKWHYNQAIDDYNVGTQSSATNASGTFDVDQIDKWQTYFRTYGGGGASGTNNSPPDPDTSLYYWSDEVKNYVHLEDKISYFGEEDWGIIDPYWNGYRCTVTVNSFTHDANGSDISVTLTSDHCYPANFSVLAVIVNVSAVTDNPWSNGAPYPGGEAIYPNVSRWGEIMESIQFTGDLLFGESTTLTWDDVGPTSLTSGYKYQLWVNGGKSSLTIP